VFDQFAKYRVKILLGYFNAKQKKKSFETDKPEREAVG
jgi:hypothetical protein